MDMKTYLAEMPKAELHLHLEGSVPAETVVKITERNNIDYFRSVEEIAESLANRPAGLMGFLGHHFKLQEVMQKGQDFYDAVYHLIANLAENNVVYTDIFFDPQVHTSRGIPFAEFFEAMDAARQAAKDKFVTEVNWIMCFNRERSVESALAMLDQARPYKDKIIGLGMDSGPEYGNPPVKFKDVYARAREEGYFLTGHCDVDVQDTLKHMWQCVDVIGIDRIDHGLNSLEDPKLVEVFIERGICLTVSPVKRSTDPVLQDYDRIAALDELGVCVSIHTDDPEEFETGYLTNMMTLFQEASGYAKSDMTRLMLNAFKALWIPEKDAYIQQLRDYAEGNGVAWKDVTRQ